MGNSAPHRSSDTTGKVVLSNGDIFTYDKAITVAELMLEHPQEVVVEYQPVLNGKKPIPLPADKELEMNKSYLMLPLRKGKPVFNISSEDARTLLNKTNSLLSAKALSSYTGVVPFLARVGPILGLMKQDATMLVDVKIKFLEERKNELEEVVKSDYFAEILEGRPEFLSRQLSGKSWKPSLDPIKEKAVKAKVRHWLLL